MTARSTHRKRRILPGFLVVLLVFIGLTTTTPTLAASSNCAGISDVGPSSSIRYAFTSPQSPQHNGYALCDFIDNETDDDPQSKYIPVQTADQFLFEHFGATRRNEHPQLLTVSSGASYRLPALYMLTERFRL